MNIQQVVEDFENALWTGQNPDIYRFIKRCPEEKRLALFLLLDELQRFHADAVSIEIPEEVHARIYTKFREAVSVSNAELAKSWTIKRFFELAQSLGKQWEDLERAFSIPIPQLKQLANDLTLLTKPSEFGNKQRLALSKKYSLELSSINKIINRAFSAIRFLEGRTVPAFTRSKEGDIEHLKDSREKLIELIFQDDVNL
ncbi:hypothetical protein L0337_26220 [candidate division KSB1 bacterium]|nr:hypothetical protein [candidate division KSB1 bacterium]